MKATFKVDLSGIAPTVTLDGTTFTNVAEVQVVQRYGNFPQLQVLFDAETIEVEGQGEVTLQSSLTGPTPEQFLNGINVEALAQEAVNSSSYDQSPMAVLVQMLKDRAHGN
jgi:hypothetical protein